MISKTILTSPSNFFVLGSALPMMKAPLVPANFGWILYNNRLFFCKASDLDWINYLMKIRMPHIE